MAPNEARTARRPGVISGLPGKRPVGAGRLRLCRVDQLGYGFTWMLPTSIGIKGTSKSSHSMKSGTGNTSLN